MNMAAELIFLGTAGDPIVVGQQSRASGGLVLKIDDLQFHIDPGPGAVVRANQYGVNPRNTTAVLVSHAHLGHCSDLNSVVSAMTHGGLDKRGVVAGHEGAVSNEVFWPYYQGCVERILPVQIGKKFGIENVDILATPIRHTAPGMGFTFLCPEFTLSYLSDTGYFKGMEDNLLDSDVLVLNVVEPSGQEKEHNLTTDSAIRLITLAKPAFAVITHFGTKMLKADPLYEARKIQIATGVQTIAAKDGMSIDPANSSGLSRGR